MSAMNTVSSTRLEMLTKDNYDTWCIQVEALLIKNDLWGYVCGEIPRPPDPSGTSEVQAQMQVKLMEWIKADRKAKADLILSISPSEVKQVGKLSTSREVWLRLESIYASSGPARKATLLRKLTLHRMSEHEEAREHINQFMDVVSKLEAMDVPVHEDLQGILLLNSLPPSYENFCCAIGARDALPKPEVLKIKILEEAEARRQKMKQDDSGALLANKGTSFQLRRDQTRYDKGQTKKKFPFKCSRCGKQGHKAADCYSKIQNKQLGKVSIADDDSFLGITNNMGNVFRVMESENMYKWCLDSGCTSHLCRDENRFHTWAPTDCGKLNLASSASTPVKAKGTVRLATGNKNELRSVCLENTLYVPDLRTNLLSVAKVTDKDHVVIFKRNNAIIQDQGGKIKMIADRIGDLYYIRESTESVSAATTQAKAEKSSAQHWHEKLGHLNFKDLVDMVKNRVVTGVKVTQNENLAPCPTCLKGKLSALPFTERTIRSDKPLEIVYSDICGPMRVESNNRGLYFVTFIDDYSRWCEVFILRKRSDVFEKFKTYKNLVENQTGMKIKALHTDNGREYLSSEFDEYLRGEGIKRRLTVPHTPQQNGVAERKNRTLVEMARCMIFQSGLPTSFWAEAVCAANYVRNRCPTKTLLGRTPHEYWTGRVPNLCHLQVFGAKAYVLDKQPNKDKFAPRSKVGNFVGYSSEAKAYRVWIPDERKICITRDVKFLEGCKNEQRSEDIISNSTKCGPMRILSNKDDYESDDSEIQTELSHVPNEKIEGDQNVTVCKRGRGRPKRILSGRPGRPAKDYHMQRTTVISSGSTSQMPEGHGSVQVSDDAPPNFVTSKDEVDDDVFMEALEPTGNTETANDHVAGYAFSAEINLREAIKGPNQDEWKGAILDEIKNLIRNDTWKVVERPKDRNIVGCRYVLTNKYLPNGILERRKARLVAQGFSQQPGIDYNGTFAPVARLDSIRLIFALSAKYNLEVHQVDITAAYLNGHLDEEIFMKKPPLLEEMLKEIIQTEPKGVKLAQKSQAMLNDLRHEDGVCQLTKALYGLKQAGRQWNIKFDDKLRRMGLQPTHADPCVYYAWKNKKVMLVSIYVDDVLIASQDRGWINTIKGQLQEEFEVKDLGKAKYCLGIEINQDENGITICQQGYIRDIIKKFNMEDAKPLSVPLQMGTKLTNIDSGPLTPKDRPYRELIGALMYAAIATRPDIAHAVSVLAQFNNCHTENHWAAAKRVLKYLIGTINFGLQYQANKKDIEGFVDSDWGGCTIDRRSYTGYIFTLSNAAISWKSQKQKTVALSSTEAEYMGITEAIKEALHLNYFIKELGFSEISRIAVYNDNRGARLLANNHAFHQRTKHIDIRHHFVRDVLKCSEIRLEYLPTEEMIADILTKAIPRPKHYHCLTWMGIREA